MRLATKSVLAAGVVVLASMAGIAGAQVVHPFGPVNYNHDLQMFAPVELDFDNQPTGRSDGFFFNYDHLQWTTTGERTVVGDPNVQREMHPIWFDNAPEQLNPITGGTVIAGWPVQQNDITDINGVVIIRRGAPINPDNDLPIARPLFQSGIRSTLPDAIWDNGDRYELGYWEDDRGWSVGILDGPKHEKAETFGFNGGNQEGFGGPNPDGTSGLQSPHGDVYVAFRYDEGLMHGFLDVVHGAYVVGGAFNNTVLVADFDGDGILDGDGFADDLDGDGQYGPDGFDVDEPAGIPDSFLVGNNIPDYDDLVELPTAFRTLTVRESVDTDGIELMRTHRISNRHKMKRNQNHTLEIYYGARYLRFNDQFFVNGDGGVLGLSFWDTQIVNNLIGPQIGAQWSAQHGRWSTNVQGRFMFGYNLTNWRMTGGIGEDLIPGAHNHPLYLRPQSFQYGRRDDDFSPLAEMRLEARYSVTKSIGLKLGWTGLFVDNIRRASTHIDYVLPNMGLVDGGTESVFVNGFNVGFELNH